MAFDTRTPQTRRSLLAGGLGGMAALVASALGQPSAVRAGSDGDVVLGAVNTSATTTKVRNPSNAEAALWGAGATAPGVVGSSTSNIGVSGTSTSSAGVSGSSSTGSGVRGTSSDGAGVAGSSQAGIGVSGLSSTWIGVRAFSFDHAAIVADTPEGKAAIFAANGSTATGGASGYPAVLGVGYNSGPAIMGLWGGDGTGGPIGIGGQGPAGTGVYGAVPADTGNDPSMSGVRGNARFARGVYGETVSGRGVVGEATATTGTTYGVYGKVASPDGRAVFGEATGGIAVRGVTDGGTAGSFQAATGYALRAIGRVKLDQCAGLATIAAGSDSVLVNPGTNLVATTAVVATLQGSAGGSTTVRQVSVNTTDNRFRIYLTAKATSNVKVAWHAFG